MRPHPHTKIRNPKHKMTSLRAFLDSHRTKKGDKHWNLTGMLKDNDLGCYYVPLEEYEEFLSLYEKHVWNERNPSSLLERHSTYTPLLIDLDFRYKIDTKERPFDVETIKKFLKTYASAFYHFFSYSKPLRFFVLLKPEMIRENDVTKDGIHIVCGDVSLEYTVPHVLRKYTLEQNILGCFTKIVNTYEEVFDESVIQRNNWFLYGATKPNREPYTVDYCFLCYPDGRVEESDWEENEKDFLRLFSLQIGRNVNPTPLTIIPDSVAEWKMWESIVCGNNEGLPSKPTHKRVKKEEDSGSMCSHLSDGITKTKILKMKGLSWEVSECDEGYKLAHNTKDCLVVQGVNHSELGHSCVFVQRTHTIMSCFSHKTKKVPKAKGDALWRLLTEGDDDGEKPIIDDLYACKKFVECMGDEIHREGENVYIFDPSTGMWSTKEIDLFAAVHRHKNALTFHQSNPDGSETRFNYGGCTKNIKNMLVHLKPLLPDGRFITSNIDKSLAYLLFEDGIFHIPTKTFTPGFDKTKVFTARITRKFPCERNKEIEELVNSKLFILPLQNERVGRYLKMRLARSLAGCYRDKKFVCIIGEADCSKGTLTNAMRRAFGDFVMEYNANHLKYNLRSGADEAKKLSWLLPLQTARQAISNEMRMDKIPMDGNLIKSLSSGGDTMGARQNFKDESSFVPKTSFFFMGNDMPEITPKDSGIETRVRVVRFNKRFVLNPTGANELLADETIKDKLETDEWKNAIFWLIMDAYAFETSEPSEVCEETREWIPSGSAEFRNVLEERFVIDLTNESEDNFTSARDIIDYIKEKGMNMSDTKIGRELGKIGLIKTVKNINNKSTNIWKGIRF